MLDRTRLSRVLMSAVNGPLRRQPMSLVSAAFDRTLSLRRVKARSKLTGIDAQEYQFWTASWHTTV